MVVALDLILIFFVDHRKEKAFGQSATTGTPAKKKKGKR